MGKITGAAMNDDNKITMLIAEDEIIIRRYLKSISDMLNIEVIAEAQNGIEAIDLCNSLNPDIALLDINMPMINGLEVLKIIRDTNPETCIIMLTSLADIDSISKAIELGATNYILKSTPIKEFSQVLINSWKAHCV